MERIPEPELMDSPEQVKTYADEDFSEAHNQLVDGFERHFPNDNPSFILDLGCGAADILIRFAHRFPKASLVGLDAGVNMLRRARAETRKANIENRVSLLHAYLPDHGLIPHSFDAIVCNSLLHHLAEPSVLWHAIKSCAKPDAPVMVMDLFRPDTQEKLHDLVETYAGFAPPMLKEDFTNSLAAAYSIAEIRNQLMSASLEFAAEAISDRHVLVWGRC